MIPWKVSLGSTQGNPLQNTASARENGECFVSVNVIFDSNTKHTHMFLNTPTLLALSLGIRFSFLWLLVPGVVDGDVATKNTSSPCPNFSHRTRKFTYTMATVVFSNVSAVRSVAFIIILVFQTKQRELFLP
jgi:hypothetical protein